jgi:hypothetical protein
MNQHVLHPSDLSPGNLGIGGAKIGTEIFGGLADQFQIAYDAILDQARIHKSIFVGSRIFLDTL